MGSAIRTRFGTGLLVLLIFCLGTLYATSTSAWGAVGHEYLSQLTEASPPEVLAAPGAVAIDSSNDAWVADPGRGVVDKFDSSGTFLLQATEGHFGEAGKRIYSIAVAPSTDDLYVADSATGVVDIFSSTGVFLGKLTGPQEGFQKVTGEGPIGVAIDPTTGEVYVSSTFYQVIDKFNSMGKYESQIPDPPSGANTKSMAASGGNLYLLVPGPGVNSGNYVEEFDSSGNPITSFGDTSPTPDGRLVGTAAPPGRFSFEPTVNSLPEEGVSETISSGLTVDPAGRLYVVNSRRKIVDEFSSSGAYLGQVSGRETPAGHLFDPGGVAVNSTGEVYLTDFDPTRSSPGEGTGVVDVFGPEVEQRTLAVSVTGGASIWLGGGGNSSVLSSPAGVEETWGCKDPSSPLRPPFTGPCDEMFHPDQVVGCEWKCSAQFAPGTKAALLETPSKGFKFKEWSKGCSGKGPCGVTLNTDVEVGAEFETRPQFALTVGETGKGAGMVTSEPSSIVCPSTCSSEFFEGEPVSLKEVPAGGSEFVKWTGCEIEVGPPGKSECKVSITKAMEVKAEFIEIPQRTLVVV